MSSSGVSNKVKDKVWKDYTKKTSAKSQLKQMFMGQDPGKAYKKISSKLRTDIERLKKKEDSSKSISTSSSRSDKKKKKRTSSATSKYGSSSSGTTRKKKKKKRKTY